MRVCGDAAHSQNAVLLLLSERFLIELIRPGHLTSCTAKRLAAVQAPGVNFDEYQAFRCGRLAQRIFKFPFRMYIKTQSSSEYVHELVILPGLNIVVRTIRDHSFDCIPVIVDEENDRFEMVPDHRREILAGNLKRAIPHE